MGVDVWVGISDWARFIETLRRSGVDEMWDLLCPGSDSYVHLPIELESETVRTPQFDLVEDGVLRWPAIADRWYAGCVFRGYRASGSYKAHFFLRDLVEHTAQRTDTPKKSMEVMDTYISRLLPYEEDEELTAMAPCSVKGVYGFPPAEVVELAQLWRRSRDRIEDLRPVITAQLADNTWFEDFDNVAMLLQDWGEILIRAQQRGWGLFYLID